MAKKNYPALIVALYLAKFDSEAYEHISALLGCKCTQRAVHAQVGAKLNVKLNSVKNMRDEFDPYFDSTSRVGWHQRPMAPSRKLIYGIYKYFAYSQMSSIVGDVLHGDFVDVLEVAGSGKSVDGEAMFMSRSLTGQKAEEFFKQEHEKKGKPMPGKLKDTRIRGCGYDFEIASSGNKCYVEVKGLKKKTGNILCTFKEWETAIKYADAYYFAIVRNVGDEKECKIEFVKNPASKLKPKTCTHTVISFTVKV